MVFDDMKISIRLMEIEIRMMSEERHRQYWQEWEEAGVGKNAEGVHKSQPRVARESALPWVVNETSIPTLKGLASTVSNANGFCELFQSSSFGIDLDPQGVALGWNLLTPSALGIQTMRLRSALATASDLEWTC